MVNIGIAAPGVAVALLGLTNIWSMYVRDVCITVPGVSVVLLGLTVIL
jgi:hypothetical protein